MSGIIIYNLKNYKNSFEDLNKLADKLIRFALKNDLGISFNNYGKPIEKFYKLDNFFNVSDSFVYITADYLLNKSENIDFEKQSSKTLFSKTFFFFDKIHNLLVRNDIKSYELFISGNSLQDNINDFEEIFIKSDSVSALIYNEIIKNAKEYAYSFPPLRFIYNSPDV